MKPFNRMTVADVADVEADQLGVLIAWAESNRLRIAYTTTMGDSEQVRGSYKLMAHMWALAVAARERLAKLNLRPEQRMHDRIAGVGR